MLTATYLAEDATPIEKYVFKPLTGSSHRWSLSQLVPLAPGKSVLDIGAGGGGMGIELRKAGAGRLVAVEIDEHTRTAISSIYDEVFDSISPITGQTFDIVLLLDVLEHMADPFHFMKQVEALLAPGGIAVISVPNIAHWSIRGSLLLGRFDYTSRGILDRTHLQFFDRRRFLELLSSAKACRIEKTSASIVPLELILPKWLYETGLFKAASSFRIRAAEFLPGLLGYQHMGILKKP